MTVPYAFLSNGQIRTADERINGLYKAAGSFASNPFLWEGLFQLACLLADDPEKEPVSRYISESLKETDDGSFSGTPDEQVSKARAALELFEYNTDRQILKRLSDWCRYLEVEWDTIAEKSTFLCRPADLMEFLVRFYRYSGIKPVLRLCARLRSSAFDWTTALTTFRQHVPLSIPSGPDCSFTFSGSPESLDYDRRQLLINHAEALADGFRYCLYSGIFSGNRQELSAGRTAWEYLLHHHRAICGGTTADPLLSGDAADRSIDTSALAAWTEAFASQTATEGSEWAADELIRIVHNGLADCLAHGRLPVRQRVNSIEEEQPSNHAASVHTAARLCRAAVSAFRHAVFLKENGIGIRYLLEGKYLLMVKKQTVVIRMNSCKAIFLSREPFAVRVDVYCPPTETARPCIEKNGQYTVLPSASEHRNEGYFIRTSEQWQSGDSIFFRQGEQIICEATHHQGFCCFVRNRLMCLDAANGAYAYAVTGQPFFSSDGDVMLPMAETERWPLHGANPADLPVLPSIAGEQMIIPLRPYQETIKRISMFPKANHYA